MFINDGQIKSFSSLHCRLPWRVNCVFPPILISLRSIVDNRLLMYINMISFLPCTKFYTNSCLKFASIRPDWTKNKRFFYYYYLERNVPQICHIKTIRWGKLQPFVREMKIYSTKTRTAYILGTNCWTRIKISSLYMKTFSISFIFFLFNAWQIITYQKYADIWKEVCIILICVIWK